MFSVKDHCVFIVRGYAGTGKTTSVKAIVDSLKLINYQSVLLAPTGRAAKVLSQYSERSALTIHKKIYQKKTMMDTESGFGLRQNLHKNTLFIVDEASMISSGQSMGAMFGNRDLLSDLLNFVFTGKNCRLMLIGDDAQLPPVGSDHSPALDYKFMRDTFSLTLAQTHLTEVKRQALDSGILYNATILRDQLGSEENSIPQLSENVFEDVQRVNGAELQDFLEDSVNKHGIENVIIVTRSNKRANLFNQQVRHRLLWHENDIDARPSFRTSPRVGNGTLISRSSPSIFAKATAGPTAPRSPRKTSSSGTTTWPWIPRSSKSPRTTCWLRVNR